MMSDSTMLAFRCLGLCFFFGVQGGPPGKAVISKVTIGDIIPFIQVI